MDPHKYTFIGHHGLDHCNPISTAQIERLLDSVELGPDGVAADIGCGKAELLLRLIERFGVRGIGIDRSPLMIAEAAARARTRVPESVLDLREMDAATFRPEPWSLELAACLGAGAIHGGFASTLRVMSGWVRPGGYLLVGDGYWQAEPTPEFLAAMGAARDECLDHPGNLAAIAAQGLTPILAFTASADDWDRYESHHHAQIERYAAEHPEDPDAPALLARRRGWTDLYRRWGRGMLGFGVYLMRVRASPGRACGCRTAPWPRSGPASG